MRILIYGAGVIGCLYAILFPKAGYNTTIYARGKRLDSLENIIPLMEKEFHLVIPALPGYDPDTEE